MAQNMSQFLLLADRDFSEVWMEREAPLEAQWSKFLNAGSFDGKLYRREAKMAGFGGLVEIPEGGKVSYGEAITPVTKRVDFVTRGLAYVITRKLWENDEYAKVKGFEASLKRATDDDVEQFAFGLLNSATGTTISAGFDALALASTAHTRMDGGATQSNSLATALSLASFKDAVIAFKKFKDDRGRPYQSRPMRMLCAVDLEPTAEEIVGSPDRPDTANRAINSVRKYGITYDSSLYITSTTYWSLFGDRHDINVLWRNKPMTKSREDFDTDNIHRKVVLDIGRSHGEWRGYLQGNS